MATEGPGAVFRALFPLVEVLDALRIPYAITGSLASGLHGEVRSTRDADVVVDLPSTGLETLLEALRPDFYVPVVLARQATAAGSSFNIIHVDSQLKIDLYPARRQELDGDLIAQRVGARHPIEPGRELSFVSAATIVLAKLDGFRRGDGVSDQQWRDVKGVLKVQAARLDLVDLRRRAARLEIGDLLERALVESGLAP